jgi:hypothetical protein
MVLLGQLSKYFRLDPRELTHIQKIEMLYIYKRLAEWLDDTDMQRIIGEVDRLRITLRIRGRRRSLYYVFYYCQAKHMQEFGDYDTDTLRPPVMPQVENYY